MSKPIRVLIVDDHPIVRDGLRRTIDDDPGFNVVAEAGDGQTALTRIAELQPDITILDIEMPLLSGLDVARQVAARNLSTKLIFLTLHKDEDFFREAIELGGKGYLLKESAMEEILAGLRAVSAGELYLSTGIPAATAGHRTMQRVAPSARLTSILTSTERQILQRIAEGKSSKEIGAELYIHYRTVENHRTNMCRKFGVEGANALLRFALQHRESLY